jgi:hypothetical protein
MTVHEQSPLVATASPVADPFGVSYADLYTAGEVVAFRLMPGAGEADRVAHIRRLLDVSADLNYAVSAYTHRVLMHAGRKPVDGDVHDETAALHDALSAFAKQVRAVADTYRHVVEARHPSASQPRPQ